MVFCSDAKHFVQTTQHALDDLNDFAPHHLRLRLIAAEGVGAGEAGEGCRLDNKEPHSAESTLTVNLEHRDRATPKLEFQDFSTYATLYYTKAQLPSPSSSTSQLSSYLANQLHDLFREEEGSIAHRLASTASSGSQVSGATAKSNGNPSAFFRSLSRELQEKISNRDIRSFKYADTYHITFSLFSAGPIPSSWQVAKALEAHIEPWTNALSSISHFTVNSQVQLYSQYSPSVRTVKDAVTPGTQILQADLSAFINAAEWPLSPSIGSAGPTINFVLYIPSIQESPLTIADTNGATEWLIPQWGGVVVHNPTIKDDGSMSISRNLDTDELAVAFSTFRTQLLALLGLPGDDSIPHPVRIESLKRLQTTSLFLSASSTLGSLARLTQSLPSIPIPESVASNVDSAISHLRKTCRALDSGNFDEALQQARAAEKEAEQAFFEKSMVGQVYFPDEHKVAVYLPLLGPVSFPLVLGLVKELKRFITAMKSKSK